MNKKGSLNIIEPWEHGTEESINVTFIEQNNDNYLLHLSNSHKIKDIDYSYFIVRFRDEEVNNISNLKGTYSLEMGYDKEINESTFEKYDLKDFRTNFLLGEVIF